MHHKPSPEVISLQKVAGVYKFKRISRLSNIKLKYRLFLLVSLIVIIVCSSAFAMLQYTYRIYDEQIYKESAKSLQLSSAFIEAELKKIERMTYNIIANINVQSDLLEIEKLESEYERHRVRTQLLERLRIFTYSEAYVSSLEFVDKSGRAYSLGVGQAKTIEPSKRQAIAEESERRMGGYFWIPPDEHDDALILARDIRSTPNLSLLPMATIMVRIDINRLILRTLRTLGIEDDTLIIYDGEELIFQHSAINIAPSDLTSIITPNENGFAIVSINEANYFKTQAKSEGTQWTYVNLIPFEQIFSRIEMMKKVVMYMLTGLILLVLLLGVRLAQGVTRPIEGLNEKMKLVGLGNFNISDFDSDQNYPMNEVGQMHRNFRMMMEKINELISENYSKQLTIRESEFKALQAQINPHFLYNTLESINWLAKISDQTKISQMVESLGFLLRSSINRKNDLIPVEEEMEIVESYITIQKIRYDERLVFSVDIDESCKEALIPKLSLQPLLENSINYALEQMIEPCHIHVSIIQKDNHISISVADNGPGMDEDFLTKLRSGQFTSKGMGIGLQNIDERIKTTFGDQFGIRIDSKRYEGTKVTIDIPLIKGGNHVQSDSGR